MTTLTIRLPEQLAAAIAAEATTRKMTKSDVVRERLTQAPAHPTLTMLDLAADLIGPAKGLPAELAGQRKDHLRKWGYGQKHHR